MATAEGLELKPKPQFAPTTDKKRQTLATRSKKHFFEAINEGEGAGPYKFVGTCAVVADSMIDVGIYPSTPMAMIKSCEGYRDPSGKAEVLAEICAKLGHTKEAIGILEEFQVLPGRQINTQLICARVKRRRGEDPLPHLKGAMKLGDQSLAQMNESFNVEVFSDIGLGYFAAGEDPLPAFSQAKAVFGKQISNGTDSRRLASAYARCELFEEALALKQMIHVSSLDSRQRRYDDITEIVAEAELEKMMIYNARQNAHHHSGERYLAAFNSCSDAARGLGERADEYKRRVPLFINRMHQMLKLYSPVAEKAFHRTLYAQTQAYFSKDARYAEHDLKVAWEDASSKATPDNGRALSFLFIGETCDDLGFDASPAYERCLSLASQINEEPLHKGSLYTDITSKWGIMAAVIGRMTARGYLDLAVGALANFPKSDFVKPRLLASLAAQEYSLSQI